MKVDRKLMGEMREFKELVKKHIPYLEKFFDVDLSDVKLRELDRLKGVFVGGAPLKSIPFVARVFGHTTSLGNTLYLNLRPPFIARVTGILAAVTSPPLEQVVLHELTHQVWERLRNNRKNESQEERIWNEGFAVYCSEILFKGVYPSHMRIVSVTGKDTVYAEGLKRIKGYINQYGTLAVRDLPKLISNGIKFRFYENPASLWSLVRNKMRFAFNGVW